jgi:hypothetical protein
MVPAAVLILEGVTWLLRIRRLLAARCEKQASTWLNHYLILNYMPCWAMFQPCCLCRLLCMQATMQPDTETTTLNHLPPHLQHHIFASAAAPLTICKASAAITSDVSLVAIWLLNKHDQPLWIAAKHQLWDVCSRLLGTHQYRPNPRELCNAVNRVACKGNATVVSSLLQLCCKEHHQLCDMCQSLQYALIDATVGQHTQVVSLLAQHPAITTQGAREAVCVAAGSGYLEVLQALITTRPDASGCAQMRSPLYDAAQQGQVEAMQLLLHHGADLHNATGSPWSSVAAEMPFKGAAMSGRLEAVRWFHEQGMTEGEVGEALVAAASGGHVPVAQYLLQEGGANASLYGPPALERALSYGRWEVACLLLEAGTPTNAIEATTLQAVQEWFEYMSQKQWDTLLQAATQHGHTQFAEMLRELRTAAK